MHTFDQKPQPDQGRSGGVRFPAVRRSATVQVQPALKIGTPGDVYEQEADRVALQVMRAPAAAPRHACACPGTCPTCRAAQAERARLPPRRTQAAAHGPREAPPIVNQALAAPGRPLHPSTRAFMGPRFGFDFSRVRIHTEARAAQAADTLNARAFTVGPQVVFGAGQYRPGTADGDRLIAHELTHVVQQSGGHASATPSAPLVQRADLEILPEGFTGAPQDTQQLAARSCAVTCGGDAVGTLHVMPLFHHIRSSDQIVDPSDPAMGVGTALHFMGSGAQGACACDDFNIIQVVTTTHPQHQRTSPYVDNAGTSTPFYSEVRGAPSGTGRHQVPAGYPKGGDTIDTTRSIYDRPSYAGGVPEKPLNWQAEARVVCVRNNQPDKILGGATYGFTRGIETDAQGAKAWKMTVDPIEPACSPAPTQAFMDTLGSDPTVKGYDFE